MDPTSAVSRKSAAINLSPDNKGDVEDQATNVHNVGKPTTTDASSKVSSKITAMGFKVLALLAFQNSFKNILMRVVMKDHGGFLLSTAILIIETLKLVFSVGYIVFVQKRSPFTVITYIRQDWKNTLLMIVPATTYSVQMSLEYIALANLDAASFSVVVQLKMLTTAFFSRVLLKRRLMKKQVMSLIILTVGVMLCNTKNKEDLTEDDKVGNKILGIAATLGIACSSGMASVYTEKVIKAARKTSTVNKEEYGLAYTQCQLAAVSLVVLGLYALIKDFQIIMEKGFFYNYDKAAFASSLNSAVGGLIVASVLKYADSVLKGYATAVAVVLTGFSSSIIFGTKLSFFYALGMVNVVVSVLLYSADGLDGVIC